jgi:hypothetical protein
MKKLLILIAVLFAFNFSPLMAAMSEAEIADLAAQVAAAATEEEAAQLVYDAVKANPDQMNAILDAVKDAAPQYSNVATTAANNAMMAATTAAEAVSEAYSDPTSHGAIGPDQTPPGVSPN